MNAITIQTPFLTSRVRENADLRRRIAWLGILRSIVMLAALGASIWLDIRGPGKGSAVWTLSAIAIVLFGCTVAYALALRRQVSPQQIARIQLPIDVVVTSAILFVTGGALSPYGLLYALSIIGAAAVLYRRGAVFATLLSLGLFVFVALLARAHWFALPMVGGIAPWEQTRSEFLRAVSANAAALVGVGALGYILADQLRRAAESLASEIRAAGDLYTLYQDIVSSLTSGLITTDVAGNILSINSTALTILKPLEPKMGSAIDLVFPGLLAKIGEAPEGSLRRLNLTQQRENSELALGVSASPLFDSNRKNIGHVINFQDLTELRRMEQHVVRSERLATVGQLAAGIAHEIRNPLAAISGSVELLRSAPQFSDEDRSLMSIVNREIDRLNSLITELLEYANPRPPQLVEFDVSVMLAETIEVAAKDPLFAEVELKSSLTTPLVLKGDAGKLRQVIWNLLRNAAEAAALAGKTVNVSSLLDDSNAVISISDSGEGISQDKLPRIFDPFFTTKKRGTGLGLAMCHSIVTDHGGRIEVKSQVHKGTTMSVYLPLGGREQPSRARELAH